MRWKVRCAVVASLDDIRNDFGHLAPVEAPEAAIAAAKIDQNGSAMGAAREKRSCQPRRPDRGSSPIRRSPIAYRAELPINGGLVAYFVRGIK